MIRIHRQRSDEQGRAIEPGATWRKKADTATKQALKDKDKHEADRNIYAADVVKRALEKLFHFKCAYCERSIRDEDWDVEHFRPKGRVAERPDHPGYYWLAYDWANLFPACTHCNQLRRDQGTWDDPETGPSGGKLDHFPIADEANRILAPGNHNYEQEGPLLLNPCRDQPEDCLTYTADGGIVALAENPKGLASIRIYHLGRKRLRDLRKIRIAMVTDLLQKILDLEDQGLAAAAGDFRTFLDKHFLADPNPHAGVARAILRDPAAFGLA